MAATFIFKIILILAGVLAGYGLLYLLIPKGNMIHEALRIPLYLLKVKRQTLEGMTVQKHSFGPHAKQYILVCRPEKGATDTKLAILYHHGGGWQFGRPAMFLNNAHVFVSKGYIVFMPCYRKIPFYSYPEIREDISLGLKRAISTLDESGYGDTKLILGGMSAGGNLAALLALDQQQLKQHGIDGKRIAGLMLFGAPMNLFKMPPSPVISWYAGKRGSMQFKNASPLSHLRPKWQLPVFCVHGKKDGLVPFASFWSFVENLDEVQKADWHLNIMETGTHLDAGRWSLGDHTIRAKLYKWLEALPNDHLVS